MTMDISPTEIVNVLPESLLQHARIRNLEDELTAVAATKIMVDRCEADGNMQLYRTFRRAHIARLEVARNMSERIVGESWTMTLIRHAATAGVEDIDLINQVVGDTWHEKICAGGS